MQNKDKENAGRKPVSTQQESARMAASLAGRMLAGMGDLSLVALRGDSHTSITVMAHGLSEQGQVIVSCPMDEVRHLCDGEVRVDILKKAPEFGADLMTASLHALGEIRWQQSNHFLRFGVIDLDMLYLHGTHNPQLLEAPDIIERFIAGGIFAEDELVAREIVARCVDKHTGALIGAAQAGDLPGTFAVRPGDPLFDGGEYVLDVSEAGLTLMSVTREAKVTAELYFEESALTLGDLAEQVNLLVEKAAS